MNHSKRLPPDHVLGAATVSVPTLVADLGAQMEKKIDWLMVGVPVVGLNALSVVIFDESEAPSVRC